MITPEDSRLRQRLISAQIAQGNMEVLGKAHAQRLGINRGADNPCEDSPEDDASDLEADVKLQ